MKGKWLVAMVLLVGCASKPQEPSEVVYVSYQVPKRFEALGKVGLRYPHCPAYEACKVENYQLEFVWQHEPEFDELRLIDPLGKERLRVKHQGGIMFLSENGGQVQQMSAQDLEQQLGLKLPIAEFKALFTEYSEAEKWQEWRLKRGQFEKNHYQKVLLEQGDYRINLVLNEWIEK